MEVVNCRTRQGLEIGEDIEVIVVAVESGLVHLEIHAPGRRVTRIDPVTLPGSATPLRLRHLEEGPAWPPGSGRRKVVS